MKKIYLIFAGMFVLATGLVSCSSEDAVTKENTEAFKFAKTPEMVNFETALRTYMRNKQQGGTTDIKPKTDNELVVKEKAVVLLNSLGKQQLAAQKDMETEQLLLVAMKEYSKKLTGMYHESNINQK